MINLPPEFTPPDYDGGSIANVPATIAAWLGAPFQGLPPLRPEFQPANLPPINRVVLLVVDALGWNHFKEAGRIAPQIPDLLAQTAVQGRLTSIFPSTTVAALSSLWTGLAPAQHGMLGLRLLLPRFGVQGQMIKMSPEFDPRPDTLVDAGLDMQSFLAGPGFAEQLAAAGIPSYSVKHYRLSDTALSRMHGRGVKKQIGIISAAHLFVKVRQLLEETAGQPLFVSAYWADVDTLSHFNGPHGEATVAEAVNVFHLMQRHLLEPLSDAGRAGTLLCVVADHGQVDTPAGQRLFLRDHPALEQLLLMHPAGEPRVPYFYARQGQVAAVQAYLQQTFGEAMAVLPSQEALTAGLFGPPPHAPVAAERVGDVLAILRQGYALFDDTLSGRMVEMTGRHGGMTADEMEVPWLVFALG